MKNRATGEMAETSQWETMKGLLPYLWPAGRNDLKMRVVIALALLVLSKIITVWAPFAFKAATDGIVATHG